MMEKNDATTSIQERSQAQETHQPTVNQGQQRLGHHHEPSYLDMRQQRSLRLSREPSTNNNSETVAATSPAPPRHPESREIEKPEPPDVSSSGIDDDDADTSSLTSVETRTGRFRTIRSTASSGNNSNSNNSNQHQHHHRVVRLTRSISEVRDGIATRRELAAVEAGDAGHHHHPLEKQPTPAANADDPNLVTWLADDPENPKTWTFGKKWAAVMIVSTFTLISPVSSSMTAPALDAIGAELGMGGIEKELSLSIFVLAYAVGKCCTLVFFLG